MIVSLEVAACARPRIDGKKNPTRSVGSGITARAGDRTRTGDVQLGKLAFYQLNYARMRH